MEIITALVRGFEDYDVFYLQDRIKKAKVQNQTTLPVLVDSTGGSVYALLKMIDSLKASGLKIITVLNGSAMSAGAVLFALGEKRYMSDNSRIMIHDASCMLYGKVADMKSLVNHIDELNNTLYSILNEKADKPKDYFQNLVKANSGADLYFNSEKALEHGLATEIKIPSNEELQNKQSSENRTIFQNYKILMELSENDTYIKPKEVKTLEIEAVLAGLNEEQKKTIIELNASFKIKQSELDSVTSKLSEKETEINSLKSSYEDKINKINDEQDKTFIQSLIKNFQLSKADSENELKMLKELSVIPEAKQSYKDKLLKASKIVEGEIPDNGESGYQFEASDDSTKQLKAIAQKHNLDLNKSENVIKAQMLLFKQLGGK